MKKQAFLQKTLLLLIQFLVIGICVCLIVGGVVLYIQGTAAVKAQTAEAVFTREQAAAVLRLFLIPALLLVALLVWAALLGVKNAPVNGKAAASLGEAEHICARREMNPKRFWLILVIAAGLIGAGIMNGGLRDVLIKAINICTECIGLG